MEKIDESDPFILKSDEEFNFVRNHPSVASYILEKLTWQNENITSGIIDGCTAEKMLYRDFEPLSRRFASGLVKRGFKKGDILIYATDEPLKLHICLLGVWRANGVLRASYPEDLGDLLLSRLEECYCKWVLCDRDNLRGVTETVSKSKWPVNILVFGEVQHYHDSVVSIESLFNDSGEACPELNLSLTDIAAILPTSGTTGKCKGVVVTHESLLANYTFTVSRVAGHGINGLLHLGRSTHGTALLNFALVAKACQVVRLRSKDNTPANVCRAIEQFQLAGLICNGIMITKVLAFAQPAGIHLLRSLKYVRIIGTGLAFPTVQKLLDLPGSPTVCLVYGSTEAQTVCRGLTSKENMPKLVAGATGKLAAGVHLAVRSDSGALLGPGVQGELWVKSRHTSTYYYNNVKETENTFQDGWLRTGDLGWYDLEGFVYVSGRLKDNFKCGGYHVSPLEIEHVLLGHTDVVEACVKGVADPNGLGDFPKAFIVLREGATCSPQDVTSYANERVPTYMHLSEVEIRLALPYGPGGKVQRNLLSEL